MSHDLSSYPHHYVEFKKKKGIQVKNITFNKYFNDLFKVYGYK